jgi:hypothetical protein
VERLADCQWHLQGLPCHDLERKWEGADAVRFQRELAGLRISDSFPFPPQALQVLQDHAHAAYAAHPMDGTGAALRWLAARYGVWEQIPHADLSFGSSPEGCLLDLLRKNSEFPEIMQIILRSVECLGSWEDWAKLLTAAATVLGAGEIDIVGHSVKFLISAKTLDIYN